MLYSYVCPAVLIIPANLLRAGMFSSLKKINPHRGHLNCLWCGSKPVGGLQRNVIGDCSKQRGQLEVIIPGTLPLLFIEDPLEIDYRASNLLSAHYKCYIVIWWSTI